MGNRMKKVCTGLAGLLLMCALICFFSVMSSFASYPVEGEEDEGEDVNIEDGIEIEPSPGPREPLSFNIFEDIGRARALLKEERCGFEVIRARKVARGRKGRRKRSRVVGKAELGRFTILVATENLKTRRIKILRVHPKLACRSGGVVVEPGKANGVNTKFTIIHPDHHVVLAIKRPVRHGKGFKEVVYTPYSEDLDIPVVRKAGLEYLRSVLAWAKRDLIRRGVRPLSGDAFVEDDVALALAIIEHIDPLKFQSGKYTAEKLIHETLVIMGTNTESAYRYSASKAGARGLFQFIPKTYRRMALIYPRAGLKKDFVGGMEDHENAAKASFLLFDADMRVLGNGSRDYFISSRDGMGRFLASAYNCGSGRTRAALDRYGDNWAAGVPAETQVYLRKFDAVWEWLYAGGGFMELTSPGVGG